MAKNTKYRKPTLESLRLQLGYDPLFPTAGGAATGDKHLLEKYEARFVRDGLTQDGKRIRIDERTGKPYNPSDAKRYINLNKYGTETPEEDFEYLRQKDILDRKEKTGPMGIRRFFSERGTGGSKFVDLEHAAFLQERRKDLEELKKGTSFNEVNQEPLINNEPFKLPGEFPGTREEFEEKYGTGGEDEKVGENLSMTKDNYNVAMQGGDTVFVGTDTEIFNKKELLKEKYAGLNRLDLAKMGGEEYESNYQTAIKQKDPSFSDFEKTGTEKHWKDMSQWERLQAKVKARGWPAKIAKLKREQSTFGITRPIDSEWNQPTSKDPNQTSSKDSIELPSYAEYGTGGEQRVNDWVNNKGGFEQNVGSEIKNTGEGGEVFTTPTPLSEEYKKSLFNPTGT
jgi:hypothetical protein